MRRNTSRQIDDKELEAIVQRAVERAAEEAAEHAVEAALAPMRKQHTTWMEQITRSVDPTNSNRNRTSSYQLDRGKEAFGAMVKGLYLEGVNGARMALAERGYSENQIKAMSAGDSSGGGVFIQGDMADDIIELLRPMTVIRSSNPRMVRAPRGTKTFPRWATSASASYVNEGEQIAVSTPTTDELVLRPKKLAALCNVNNELLTFAGSGTEAEISDVILEEVAETEDANFLRGDGTQNKPKGIRYWAQAANITSTNGTSSANIESDFKDLIEDLEGNNVRMRRPVWIMASRSKNHLLNLRDANGNLIYPEIRSTSPSLYQIPVKVTNQVPTNLGGGTATEVYLCEMDDVVVGDVEGVSVSISTEASYVEGSTTRSAFQHDQTLIRVIMHNDLIMRHPESCALKSDITWGA